MSSANSTNLGNFTTNSTDEQPSVAALILLGFLVLAGAPANGYIIIRLLKKSRRSPLNLTILNLAIVDAVLLTLVIPLGVVVLTVPGVPTLLCSITGILRRVLLTYSLHVQCLTIYTTTRIACAVSPNSKQAINAMHLILISLACLAVDAFVVTYPSVKHADLRIVPALGCCFFTYNSVGAVLLRIFYGVHLTGSVFLCTISCVFMAHFVRKNSANRALSRRRQVRIFKMMFRKHIVWVLSYYAVVLTRFFQNRHNWPEVIFHVSVFVLWSNSLLNPLCHYAHIFRRSARESSVAPEQQRTHTDQPNIGTSSDRNNRPVQYRFKKAHKLSNKVDASSAASTEPMSRAEGIYIVQL